RYCGAPLVRGPILSNWSNRLKAGPARNIFSPASEISSGVDEEL
ncbi:hypothetical protein AVEN_216579-1, partial [Araneus ventricosus]